MIFVTVGTHEQPFNRLIKKIDELKRDELFGDDVVIQTGYSDYKPNNCEHSKFFGHDEMQQLVKDARIVITHGGPSSFIMPLQVQKVPIVVPRLKAFNEHVNNHQLDFARQVATRQKNILVVENIDNLGPTIHNYESEISKLNGSLESNNSRFNKSLQNMVDDLF
ncbi:glycosyltransferase [Lactiplantibacillus plajomi]|uniref:Glycosyltransferase n=1 Tax=Lactiplantibacillus plajomi TaxID=1457217 RepID=A0ABV6K2S9_9LACO|nr:glycosyltransferase [Lactiplantibacillus plajomi]